MVSSKQIDNLSTLPPLVHITVFIRSTCAKNHAISSLCACLEKESVIQIYIQCLVIMDGNKGFWVHLGSHIL